MAKFPGVDYLLIDSQLNEQELMVRQTARQFVDERVIPLIRDCYRDGRFPKALIGEMGRSRFFGANLEGYGCAGMNNVEYGSGDAVSWSAAIRGFAVSRERAGRALVMYPIYAYGSEEQKQKWLPRLQSGDAIGCFGLTEPGFGSNPAGMLTRATRDGSDWVLNGGENVDHQWIDLGCRDYLGARRGRDSRVPRGKRHIWIFVVGAAWEIVDAGVGDGESRVERRSGQGVRDAAGRQGAEGTAGMPDAGSVRDRVGGDRRGDGLLRDGAIVLGAAETVRR